MPDQLYRRCPDCLDSAPGAPCPTCAGERYIPAKLDGEGRRRWRLRISTLMLLVVIAGLASYIAADLRHRAEDARRLEAAVAEARFREAIAAKANVQAQAQIPAPAAPTE